MSRRTRGIGGLGTGDWGRRNKMEVDALASTCPSRLKPRPPSRIPSLASRIPNPESRIPAMSQRMIRYAVSGTVAIHVSESFVVPSISHIQTSPLVMLCHTKSALPFPS